MKETFKLYNADTYLGDISYDRELDKYEFQKSDATEKFPPEFAKHPTLGTPKDIIREEDVRFFVEDRVLPENRQALYLYLELLGLGGYDPWELLVTTSGMCMIDFYWINSYGAKDFSQHARNTGKLPMEYCNVRN